MPERSLTYPQLFKAIYGEASGNLFGSHTLRTEGGVDAVTGQGKGSSFWFYSAAGAEVEVDTETGKVRVLQVASAVDVGKAVHPLQCSLQNEGSALAGLGSALFEEIRYDNGQPINSTFLDYLLPSMLDHPGEFQIAASGDAPSRRPVRRQRHGRSRFAADGAGDRQCHRQCAERRARARLAGAARQDRRRVKLQQGEPLR